jgi:hypothetical protein
VAAQQRPLRGVALQQVGAHGHLAARDVTAQVEFDSKFWKQFIVF